MDSTALSTTRPIRVWKLPPIWGTPSPSPFVIKLETWLRMAGIPYEPAHLKGPPRSRTGKIPYVTLPDGEVLADSSIIVERLRSDRGIGLDAGLPASRQATGHAVRRMLEESLYFVGVYERWVGSGFSSSARDYFAHMPPPVRFVLPRVIRARMRRALHGQGTGRLTDAERAERGRADLEALSAVLGEQEFVLGPPSTVDATALGFLWAMSANPYPSPLTDAIRDSPRLLRYIERMRARYWSGWES